MSADTTARAGALPAPPSAVSSVPWPRARTAWYAVFVMILSLTFAQLDMQIVPYLAGYIRSDLGLTDFELSLLLGASFGLFYTIVGVPLAWFIDRRSRKWILALGITTWSIGTALCGAAQNFWQLFVSRFLVGAGEAVNGPASYSIVADLFPRQRLPRAITVLLFGTVFGSAGALFISAFLIERFINIPSIEVPFGIIRGWQLIFILVGLPGVLVGALIALTMPEPVRRILAGQIAGVREEKRGGLFAAVSFAISDFGDAFNFLFKNWRVFGPMFLGLAIGSLNMGVQSWLPIFYDRTFGWEPSKVARLSGVGSLIVMPTMMLVGMWLAERYEAAGRNDGPLRVLIISRIVGLPAAVAAPLMPTPWLAFALFTIAVGSVGLGAPSQNAAMQTVTPNQMRGKITALYILVFSVVGYTLGPMVTAGFTDFVFKDESLIRWSIFTSTIIFMPLSLFVIWLGRKPYGEEVARLKALERADAPSESGQRP